MLQFDCKNCYQKELERVKALDKEANKDKGFFSDKQKTELDINNYRRTASEVVLVSKNHTDYDQQKVEEHPQGISGFKLICSICGQTTFNYIHVGISEI